MTPSHSSTVKLYDGSGEVLIDENGVDFFAANGASHLSAQPHEVLSIVELMLTHAERRPFAAFRAYALGKRHGDKIHNARSFVYGVIVGAFPLLAVIGALLQNQ